MPVATYGAIAPAILLIGMVSIKSFPGPPTGMLEDIQLIAPDSQMSYEFFVRIAVIDDSCKVTTFDFTFQIKPPLSDVKN